MSPFDSKRSGFLIWDFALIGSNGGRSLWSGRPHPPVSLRAHNSFNLIFWPFPTPQKSFNNVMKLLKNNRWQHRSNIVEIGSGLSFFPDNLSQFPPIF